MNPARQAQVRTLFTISLLFAIFGILALLTNIFTDNTAPINTEAATSTGATTNSVCQTGEEFYRITFDELFSGQEFFTEPLGNPYTAKGISFSTNAVVWNSTTSTNPASVWTDAQGSTTSTPNSICIGNTCGGGSITIDFSKPVNYFEVYALSGPGNEKLSSGVKVDLTAGTASKTLTASNTEEYAKLSHRQAGITKAVLTGGNKDYGENWDDLVVCFASTSGGGGGGGGNTSGTCGTIDINTDNKVCITDLSGTSAKKGFAQLYGSTCTGCTPTNTNNTNNQDYNGNCKIDLADLSNFASKYSNTCQ